MGYTRISPGIYRDDATGKTVRSPTNPGAGKGSTPVNPVAKPNGSNSNIPDINFGNPNQVLDAGVNTGVRTNAANDNSLNANYKSFGGSQTTTIDPKTGQATVSSNLSQPNQSILSNQQQAGQNSYNLLNGFLSGNGDDPHNPLSQLQQSTYNRLTGAGQQSGLEKSYQQNKEQLTQSLANRGIPVGSELYNNQMKQLDEGHTNAMQNAQDSAYQQSFSQLGQLNTMGQQGFIDPKTGQAANYQGSQFQSPSAQDIYGTFQGGQNVAGTNKANIQIGSGHDAASVAAATAAGKYALLGKLAEAGNPTFTGAQPTG